MIERELLGARVQLDPLRAPAQCALGLLDGASAVGTDPAERRQQAVRATRRLDHHVVGRRIAVRFVHREHERAPRLGLPEDGEQLRECLAHAVGIVLAEVGVGIEQLHPRDLFLHLSRPGSDESAEIHCFIRTMDRS